jgi:hypothetical protein
MLRTRIGLTLARLGGAGMVLGGVADISIRSLLPGHRDFLGLAPGDAAPATESLVLALLHALGAALVASGVAVLVLLHLAHATGRRLPALAAAAVAILAEGTNTMGLRLVGSPLFYAPLTFLLLVAAGVATCFIPRWELAQRSNGPPASGG